MRKQYNISCFTCFGSLSYVDTAYNNKIKEKEIIILAFSAKSSQFIPRK